MYFGRLEEDSDLKATKTLPNEWLEEFTKTLNEVYHERLKATDRFFDVYGEIYEKEFVVIVSYLHAKEQAISPISLFVSHDNQEDSKKFKKTLKDLVDFCGVVFDDIFATPDWNEFNSNWTENIYKNSTFYYKLTRENISLTLQAEALLNKEIEI